MNLLIVVSQPGDAHKIVVNMKVGRGTTAQHLKKRLYKGPPDDVTVRYMENNEEVTDWIEKTKLYFIVKEKDQLNLSDDKVFVDTIDDERTMTKDTESDSDVNSSEDSDDVNSSEDSDVDYEGMSSQLQVLRF